MNRLECVPDVYRAIIATGPSVSTGRWEGSAPGRTRTCNLLIRSQVLYPLSYGRWSASGAVYRAAWTGPCRALSGR